MHRGFLLHRDGVVEKGLPLRRAWLDMGGLSSRTVAPQLRDPWSGNHVTIEREGFLLVSVWGFDVARPFTFLCKKEKGHVSSILSAQGAWDC